MFLYKTPIVNSYPITYALCAYLIMCKTRCIIYRLDLNNLQTWQKKLRKYQILNTQILSCTLINANLGHSTLIFFAQINVGWNFFSTKLKKCGYQISVKMCSKNLWNLFLWIYFSLFKVVYLIEISSKIISRKNNNIHVCVGSNKH